MGSHVFGLYLIVVSMLWVVVNCQNRCDEPRSIGPCRARIPRYFYNRSRRQCERFFWGGCRPNGNNFRTEKECNAACSEQQPANVCDQPQEVGPCKARVPRFFFNKRSGRCERFFWGGCRPNGNNFQTKQECSVACNEQQPENVCNQPKKVGPCEASTPRYFFNKRSGRCERFFWGGCRPNGNNFRTKAECRAACSDQQPIDVCDQPKDVGPCDASIPRFYFNKRSGRCERFIWGGCAPNENNFRTISECRAACSGQKPVDVCDQPKDAGPCYASIPRFYYNKLSGRCERFIWGGCAPNGNNFRTVRQCRATCANQQPENMCDQPKKIGPCRARIPRFFFNKLSGQCERFFWGGCRPNSNNFRTERQCRAACSGQQPENVCDQPRKIGPCRASIPRFFFNKRSGRCEQFSWGGCSPNGNNFRSHFQCSLTCSLRWY